MKLVWRCGLVTVSSFLLAGLAGCAQVPDVERSLQSLHFDASTYVVQAGDTIESLAFRYKMTPEELASLNRHVGSQLVPGDRLVVKRFPVDESNVDAYTGQGWYRGMARNRQNNQSQSGTIAATTHTTTDRVDAYGNEVIPDDAEIAEIQANFRAGGVREEIIADDLDDSDLVLRQPEPVARAPQPEEQPAAAVAGTGAWIWPSNGAVARDYAPNEVNGQGLDIAGLPGQDVRAASDGTVIYTGRDLSDSGNLVIIRHAEGLLSTYSHTRDLYVAEDDFVRAGDPIASLGWNADRESVLHFEVRKDGKPVNPRRFLPGR